MSPDLLPSLAELRRTTQSLAMLDAILSPAWEDRYYSFNDQWGPGESMASMRDGSGDEWFLLFDPYGAALKGYAHELAGDGSFARKLQLEVPAGFASFLAEPAFSMHHATFCYWRRAGDAQWKKVDGNTTEDGSTEMLALLASGPAGYREWAEEYYEVPLSLEAVTQVFAHEPLNEALILALHAEADPAFTYAQASEIGYPCRPG